MQENINKDNLVRFDYLTTYFQESEAIMNKEIPIGEVSTSQPFFCNCHKILGKKYLRKLYRESGDTISRWCGESGRDPAKDGSPLDMMKQNIADLYMAGAADVIHVAMDLLLEPLDYEVMPVGNHLSQERAPGILDMEIHIPTPETWFFFFCNT